MAKNIEMNTLNENGEYEVVYPMVTVDNIINYDDIFLSNATKIILDLDSDATPDEALLKLAMGKNKNAALVTLTHHDGCPASGISIPEYKDYFGNSAVTDENGQCVIISDTTSFTFGIISPYVNVKNIESATYQAKKPISKINLTLESTGVNELTIDSTKSYRFYGIDKIDFCAVGGGGGGQGGAWAYRWGDYNGFGGGGGGGGYVSNLLNYQTNNSVVYTFTIGSGGNVGKDGGTTYVKIGSEIILQANGGTGATSYPDYKGGIGNGNGGEWGGNGASAANKGQDGTVYKFNDSSLGLAGGGGGGGGATYGYNGKGSYLNNAGKPYGGSGTLGNLYSGKEGSGYGGGGGGGGGYSSSDSNGYANGGAGYKGCVYVRW